MRSVSIDDEVLIQAAKQYGTPCLCYEEQEIENWKTMLKNALPNRAKLIYSVKASRSPIILKNYIADGMFFETASDGELSLLLSLGADPKKIWVSGQGKNINYLKNAIYHGVSHFHIESQNELSLISSLIKKGDGYDCCIRINPECVSKNSVLHTAGQASSFGVDEIKVWQLLKEDHQELINGIFVYCGSQYFSANSIIENALVAFRLAMDFYKLSGRIIKTIDFGGGFGVPENDYTPELDMEVLRTGLDDLFKRYQELPCFSKNACFYFESGRYLVARTACLITSIIDIKNSRGQNFLITDGGINHLGVKQAEYRLYSPYIRHIGKKHNGSVDQYCITGNTCTPIDQTHPGIQLNAPIIGDYICIPDCGAYSLDFSPQNFNGFFSIPEVLHCDNGIVLYKNRGNHESFNERNEYIPIGSGEEIYHLVHDSCPVESDEVQNVIIVAEAIKLNHMKCIIYDVSQDGAEAVILIKILKKHYHLMPNVVFSDFQQISEYTDSPCYSKGEFERFASQGNLPDCFAMVTGSALSDNDVVEESVQLIRARGCNCVKVESELITSMELDFYRYYLYHISELQSSFDLLCDDTSRECYIEYIRTVLENDFWRKPVCPLNAKYWGYDFLPFMSLYTHINGEKWLNIGACNGDTILRYFANGYRASRIYAVDTDSNALARCQANMKLLDDSNLQNVVSYYHACFGCNEDELKIDDVFSDVPLTLINMDIEGGEKDTIKGATSVIQKNRPVLAVCVYHKPEDICALIRIIHSIVDGYCFYLRKYPNYPYHRYNFREELVLYAVPRERCAEKYYVE